MSNPDTECERVRSQYEAFLQEKQYDLPEFMDESRIENLLREAPCRHWEDAAEKLGGDEAMRSAMMLSRWGSILSTDCAETAAKLYPSQVRFLGSYIRKAAGKMGAVPAEFGATLPDGVLDLIESAYVGDYPERTVNARVQLCDDGALILINRGLYSFTVRLVSILSHCAQLAPADWSNNRDERWATTEEIADALEAAVFYYVMGDDGALRESVTLHFPEREGPLWSNMQLIPDAAIAFVIAHEFGHLLGGHLSTITGTEDDSANLSDPRISDLQRIADSLGLPTDLRPLFANTKAAHAKEHQADQLGTAIVLSACDGWAASLGLHHDSERKPLGEWSFSDVRLMCFEPGSLYPGIATVFGMIHLIESVQSVLYPVLAQLARTHPPAVARVNHILGLLDWAIKGRKHDDFNPRGLSRAKTIVQFLAELEPLVLNRLKHRLQ